MATINSLPNEILDIIVDLVLNDIEDALERPRMRTGLYSLSRRWYPLSKSQEFAIQTSNNAVKLFSQLSAEGKQAGKRGFEQVKELVFYFELESEWEPDMESDAESLEDICENYSYLLDQCQSIQHLTFSSIDLLKDISKDFSSLLYFSLTKLNQLKSFTSYGPCDISTHGALQK